MAYIRRLIVVSAGFKAYEMEDDVVKDLSEFALANALYAALVEGHAAETNARSVPTIWQGTMLNSKFLGEMLWTMPPKTPPK